MSILASLVHASISKIGGKYTFKREKKANKQTNRQKANRQTANKQTNIKTKQKDK